MLEKLQKRYPQYKFKYNEDNRVGIGHVCEVVVFIDDENYKFYGALKDVFNINNVFKWIDNDFKNGSSN